MSPDFRKKIEKYAPRLGVIAIVLFVVISSVIVTVQKREEYRRSTFDVYLAEASKEQAAQQSGTQEVPIEETPVIEGEDIHSPIYAAPSGKRYHYDARCPGKNSREITWDEAEQRGLTPCKKCVLK